MKYYIGADLGTSALKLILVDNGKNVIKSVTEEYEVVYPEPGWSEQSPEEWWDAFVRGVKRLTKDVDKNDVCGIGVAGQMHGLVILDNDDRVIRPAILWNDNRTTSETDYLNRVIGTEKLSQYTANIAFAGFTAPKLLWLAANESDNFSLISKIMLPKDYINFRLTGVHSSDYSDASGMLLLDVKNKCWSDEMLEICKIKKEQMPVLYESYEKIGTVLPEIAEMLGLNACITVAAGAGDNAASAVGTATVGGGRCNISLGTSGTVFIASDKFSVDENNALHSFCHADGGYHLMGCILSAASCNKWFCDEILQTKDYASEQKNISDSLLGNNNVYFLPYLMGERSPVNDSYATGMFIGLRPDTKRHKMLLAVLEGVAFAIRDNLEVAKKLGINITQSTVCGGGARSSLWVKILANVLNIELCVPEIEEGPGMGAAILAMSADKRNNCAAENTEIKIKEKIKPEQKLVELYENRYQKFKEIYPAVKELYKKCGER